MALQKLLWVRIENIGFTVAGAMCLPRNWESVGLADPSFDSEI